MYWTYARSCTVTSTRLVIPYHSTLLLISNSIPAQVPAAKQYPLLFNATPVPFCDIDYHHSGTIFGLVATGNDASHSTAKLVCESVPERLNELRSVLVVHSGTARSMHAYYGFNRQRRARMSLIATA